MQFLFNPKQLPITVCVLFILHCNNAFSQELAPVSVIQAINAPLLEEVPLTGTVTSPQIATLSTAVGGLVAKVYLDIGATVEVGTPLLQLDSELAEIDLATARASLASAQANLAEAERRVAEAQPLIKSNNIAATEVRGRESQAKIAKAELDRVRAVVQRRTAELSRHTVKAPFPGVISRKLTEAGEWVSPGAQVMELVSTNNLRVNFQVPQIYYPRINNAANLFARFDAFPEIVSCQIISTVPINNPNARTFLIQASLNEVVDKLTPGMSAQGVLHLRTNDEGVVVPRDAIIRYADGRIVVWAVNQDEEIPKVEERVVKIGLSAAGQVEIISGISAGTLVVTRGNEALQPGQQISIINFEDE